MPKILVVDDSPVDRRLAGNFLTQRPGLTAADKGTGITVAYAADGKEGLEAIRREQPDLVLTDMQMPEMSGLELVEEVRAQFPQVPIILMTAHGSEEIAIQALQRGAASYVPKRNLARDLLETVENILAVAGTKRQETQLLDECWVQTESIFRLPNRVAHIPPLIGHLQENLTRMKVCDENGLIRVAVALREALSNAMLHGNLEVGSELRERDETSYYALMEQRLNEEPYDDRYVHVTAKESHTEAVYVIRDEGRGFNPADLPDPTDPANLEKTSGRGLLLIRTFMDEVRHNKAGNEITMIKRCDRPC
jgi:CheY-like chemotaxis protein/anti-sigma regulatory factor (Ser/Thr protein kinase)